jgi:Condensation domain
LPLSYAQQRLWFLDRLQGSSTEYNVPGALRLRGELDLSALERAINAIVERHESLRTRFVEQEGTPVQVIDAELRIDVLLEDLTGWEPSRQQESVRTALRQEWEQAFDLARGPVLRMKLLRLGEQEHILLRSMHHIAVDGWSQGVFNQEFMVLYEAFREGRENPLPPLPVQYADFTLWQRKWLESGALEEGLAYWRAELADIPERLELPSDRSRPSVQTFRAGTYEMMLSAEQGSALKRLAQAHQATLYMVLLAAYGVLLSRYSGQQDIVVGSPIANRQDAQLEQLIGFFLNQLILRVRVKPEMSFAELLEAVRRTTLGAYQHQDIPFERLVEELSPERTRNTTPVFQVSFTLQNAPWKPQQFKGLQVEPLRGAESKLHFDVELHALERNGEIELHWLYDRDLFDGWRIE